VVPGSQGRWQAHSHGLADRIRRLLDCITWVVYTTWVVSVIGISRGIQWVPSKHRVVVVVLCHPLSCQAAILSHTHHNSQTAIIWRVNSQKCDQRLSSNIIRQSVNSVNYRLIESRFSSLIWCMCCFSSLIITVLAVNTSPRGVEPCTGRKYQARPYHGDFWLVRDFHSRSVFSAQQHAEHAICYRKSVRPSVCHTPARVTDGWTDRSVENGWS